MVRFVKIWVCIYTVDIYSGDFTLKNVRWWGKS